MTGVGVLPADAAPKPKSYPNCTAIDKVYPHGVAKKGARDKVSGKSKPVTNFTVKSTAYSHNSAWGGDGGEDVAR